MQVGGIGEESEANESNKTINIHDRQELEKLMTQVGALLTLKKPELLPYFRILRREGIDLRLYQALSATACESRGLKEYIIEILQSILPKNFIQSLNQELRSMSKFEPQSPTGAINQSLYHLANDSRMLQIVREGFRNLDDHGKGSESTGRIEQALGLNGIYFTYGRPYSGMDYIEVDNLAVFPADRMFEVDSVCVHGELSYGTVFGPDGPVFDDYGKELGVDEVGKDTKARKLSKTQLINYVTLGVTEILSQITTPDRAIWAAENCKGQQTFNEVCIDANKLKLPQMIIVKEEPEYFFEEAVAKNPAFANVPFLDDESVHDALESVGIESMEDFRPLFVELVNRGELNPMDWAVNKKNKIE